MFTVTINPQGETTIQCESEDDLQMLLANVLNGNGNGELRLGRATNTHRRGGRPKRPYKPRTMRSPKLRTAKKKKKIGRPPGKKPGPKAKSAQQKASQKHWAAARKLVEDRGISIGEARKLVSAKAA